MSELLAGLASRGGALGLGAVILAATALSLREWFAYKRAVVDNEHRTRRLKAALRDSSPEQRAEIIRACGWLVDSQRARPDPTDQEGFG